MTLPILSQPPANAHIAACGLFCTNCGAFKRGRCQGCQIAPGFACCPVRQCCADKQITTCAECDEFRTPRDYRECKKINSWIAKLFRLVFRSDRPGALAMLRDQGPEAYLRAKREGGKH
jgi:hypothetical protein